ncbi:MAG: hypothetical protein V1916_02100 [Patescibacteria group bacterium]
MATPQPPEKYMHQDVSTATETKVSVSAAISLCISLVAGFAVVAAFVDMTLR